MSFCACARGRTNTSATKKLEIPWLPTNDRETWFRSLWLHSRAEF